MTSPIAILLVVHVLLALSLLLPAILLPLVLRRDAGEAAPGRLRQVLVAAQGRWATVIGLGLVASGVALIAALSLDLGRQPWLLVALAIYAVNLGIAMFLQRPRLRLLVSRGAGAGGDAVAGDDVVWRRSAHRLRSMSYVMAALIGAIGFLMMTKPQLW
ncbi:MAG TPA: hypothetical protein VF494_05760 [Candidatus Limnocylindrales bacterium]